MYALLTDEVTDISNIQQLLTFIKYYNRDKCETETKFVHTADLLAESENTAADSESIFKSLKELIEEKLKLQIEELKAFVSDGASVMTGHENGVAARFRALCKTLLNIHCVCHRLALACSDTGDELTFIQNFELTIIQLWKFFKNSAKRLKIYIKVATSHKNLDDLPQNRKKKSD